MTRAEILILILTITIATMAIVWAMKESEEVESSKYVLKVEKLTLKKTGWDIDKRN